MPLGLSSVHVLSAPLLEMSALNLRAGENPSFGCIPAGDFPVSPFIPSLSKKLPFLAKLSVKQGRPPRGKIACSTHMSAFASPSWALHFSFFSIIYFSGLLPPIPLLPHCPDADFQSWCQIFCHKLTVAAFVLIRNVFSREACFWVRDREGETQHVTVSCASAAQGKMRQITNSNPRGSSREAFAEHPDESISQDVLGGIQQCQLQLSPIPLSGNPSIIWVGKAFKN